MPPQGARDERGAGRDPSPDTALRIELGSTVRRLRKGQSLTLVQLAERASLSHPFLSQLERGLARPSMQSLQRIAHALGTTQQALLAPPGPPPEGGSHLVRSGEGPPVATPAGTARMLGAGGLAVHPVEFTGCTPDFKEYYDHAGDEFLYVVGGEIEVDLGYPDGPRLHLLTQGDSLTYPGGTPHRWRAVSAPEQVRILMVQNVPDTNRGTEKGK
ncbi:helix-turn-helix domain-containing protein [Streptomyces fractus]|uniref:helix-turn-helix domain-containing protein n=1 Tax=Streptomyces fractus TaxID=641806 RepID=UPI003CFB3A14